VKAEHEERRTTVLLVEITWERANYYTSGELADVAAEWIHSALDDRDDCPSAYITNITEE
jgi:hypothetical protein